MFRAPYHESMAVTPVRFPSVFDRMVVAMVRLWTEHRGATVSARLSRHILKLLGLDWQPLSIGERLQMPHATTGSVVHCKTRIGHDVTVFHGVTIGRADPWLASDLETEEGVVVEDGVVLGANAVILFRQGETVFVRTGTVIGAGAVLRQSTGPHEVWAGNPAVRVR